MIAGRSLRRGGDATVDPLLDGADCLHHTSNVIAIAASFPALARRIARGLSRIERDQICCGDVTLQQYDTVRLLHERGALTTGDVASALGIDLSTASRNLGVLEKNGYLARVRSEADARQIVNKLTRKGTRCIESLCCDERSAFDEVFARIPASKRTAVLEALAVVADALTDTNDASRAACSLKSDTAMEKRCCP